MGILCALEEGTLTRAEVMQTSHISERTLRYRLARARRIRGDIEAEDNIPDDGDPIHLEVTSGHQPRGPGGEWYSLADDRHSLEGERVARVLITDGQGRPRIRKLWAGQLDPDAGKAEETAKPASPTAYRPHPKLKGGKG